MLEKHILEAARDYKYLLDRGYPQQLSLIFVSNRWNLSKEERMILYRCIHPSIEATSIREKHLDPESIRGNILVIDTYNVLLTLKASVECEEIFLCDDGIVRDILSSRSKASKDKTLYSLTPILVSEIAHLAPNKAIFIVDKQVSMSKELCNNIKSLATNLVVETILAPKTDKEIIKLSETNPDVIVASSDILILRDSPRVFDLAGYIIRRRWSKKLINIRL